MLSARIELTRSDAGGRRTPIASGYRPNFRFGETYLDGVIALIDRVHLDPGGCCTCEITLAHPDLLAAPLRVGDSFEITEGARIVGRGEVLALSP